MSQSIDSYKVSYNVSKSPMTRIKEINFGQGYRNILQDGFNTDEETWNVTWIPIDSTAAGDLETLLLNSVKGTSNYISWTPPGEVTTKYFTSHDIQKRPISATLWLLAATLRREFPLS